MIVGVCVILTPFLHGNVYISQARARACTHTHTHTHDRQLLCLKLFHVKDKQASKPRTALFWTITQRVVVIPYRRFGTTYRSHLQESSSYC